MRLKASDENSSQLSKKEKEILEYIIDRAESGVPPSVREICAALGYKSTSTAHKYLTLLEEKGYLEKQSGKNRSIKLRGEGFVQVPLLGTVAAGQPILAMEQIEDYIPIKTNYSSKDLFALRVKGESMVEAGILNGDIIIARQTPSAMDGEIVVALIEDEATVKRFFKEKNRFRLQPENSAMEPIYTDHVAILGKVISVFRSYE